MTKSCTHLLESIIWADFTKKDFINICKEEESGTYGFILIKSTMKQWYIAYIEYDNLLDYGDSGIRLELHQYDNVLHEAGGLLTTVQQKSLFQKIQTGVKTTTKLLEYGIPYMNSTLIYGEPGTGKTEYARFVAYKLGLPFAYINFSYLIDSYLGKTSQNLQRIFDFCKGQKCVLLLDEIDCIGIARSNDSGADGELARTLIALMQALDGLVDGQIIIAATNRFDRLDKALLRRFQHQVEFKRYEKNEEQEMIKTYIRSVDESILTDDVLSFADDSHTQAETVKFLIGKVIEKVVDEVEE